MITLPVQVLVFGLLFQVFLFSVPLISISTLLRGSEDPDSRGLSKQVFWVGVAFSVSDFILLIALAFVGLHQGGQL